MIIQLYQYGPTVAGLLLAFVAWLSIRRRPAVALPRAVRLLTGASLVLAIGLLTAFRAWSTFPAFPAWMPLGGDSFLALRLVSFLLPLALTVVAAVFLITPIPTAGPRGSAALSPRTPLTFTSRRWLGFGIGVTVAVIIAAVLAGLASITDEAGRHVMYEVPASASTRGGTTIYGWWFSVPCLIVVAGLVALTFLGLVLISRPALGTDAACDTAVRTTRVRNLLAVTTGGLLLHLGTVLSSLYATSSMRLGFDAGGAGFVVLGTPFAAIGPALQIGGFVATIVGLALWWFTLLGVVMARTRLPIAPVPA